MKEEVLVLTFFILLFLGGFIGCKKCEEQCDVAPVGLYATPEDSLCFGRWDWVYTVKRVKDWQDQWVVADTLLPGESEPGFETLGFVFGTVDEGEICFSINGKMISGCYETRNSFLSETSHGPSHTVVVGIFESWAADGYSGLGVDAYIPETLGEPVYAQISGLKMFYVADEDSEGVRYRNFFVKTE